MYDVAIIGSGPAGISAALNLKLHNKSIVWFGSSDLSTKVGKSEMIANYPGVPMTSGAELNRTFLAQIEEAGLEITDKKVTNIMATRNGFMVLGDNDIYEARSILLAIGSVPGKGLVGENEYLGNGVSYCATCDGFLCKGKTIAVFCGDKRYEHEVEYLAGIADKVYLQTGYPDSEIDLPNVERLPKPIKEVRGELKANGIVLTDGSEIAVEAVFFLRNAIAPATILSGLEMDGAHIVIDRDMATSIPGCYAAGDCTGRPYQIAIAVGEGNTAAHSILEYLSGLDKNGAQE